MAKVMKMKSSSRSGNNTSNSWMSSKSLAGLKLYAPAFIAAVAYIILIVTVLLPFEFPAYDEATGQEYIVKYDLGQRLISLLLMTIPIALSIYTINCMIAGNCWIWSYVVSIVTVIWVAIFVITAFMYTFRKA